MQTARVRRETGLMRLLTAMVSGGTPRLVSCPSLGFTSKRRICSAALMLALASFFMCRLSVEVGWFTSDVFVSLCWVTIP